jgi:hypothetical protein
MVKFPPKDTKQNKKERIFPIISELPSRRNQGGKEVKRNTDRVERKEKPA